MNSSKSQLPKALSSLPAIPKSQQRIAIIGGGIAGLSCAKHLAQAQTFSEVVVFDTGRLRPGGRCSSRSPNDPPADSRKSRASIIGSQVVDHAAQIVSVASGDDSHFSRQVAQWEKDGILKRFPKGSVCEIIPGRTEASPYQVRKLNENSKHAMFYGVNGMGSIPMSIAKSGDFEIKQDVWVSPSSGIKFLASAKDESKPFWRVKGNNKQFGDFHQIVIAHNGKCADRIMSKTPAKALHSLLRTNFSPTVPKNGGKRMTLNSIYSLTFAIKRDDPGLPIPKNVMSAFVKNQGNLRFLTCNTRKHRDSSPESQIETWTLLSSPNFGKKYKGPQENLPGELQRNVTSLLLTSLEQSLDLPKDTLTGDGVILDSKLQLWGAAVPINTWKVNSPNPDAMGFLYDDVFSVGACGDWLLESSIEGAWESGRRLASWMLRDDDLTEPTNNKTNLSVGLPPDGYFQPSSAALKAGIGFVAGESPLTKQ